jgi:hypothetical protein
VAIRARHGSVDLDNVDGAGSSDSPRHQQQFAVGASVWDRAHNECRGYGVIQKSANTAPGHTRKWYVAWERKWEGQRCTAILETSLELSHIHHRDRMPPSALEQAVLVVLGRHKGKTGTTHQKVGEQPWLACWPAGLLAAWHCRPA